MSRGHHPVGITDPVKIIIKKTWKDFLSRGSMAEIGFPMFTHMFKILPETAELFHYKPDDPDSKEKLESHIELLFTRISVAIDSIDHLGEQTEDLIQMGHRHKWYGVKPEFYRNFGDSLLYAIEQALGKDFTEEARDAMTTFYHWIGGCIVTGINNETVQCMQ